MIARATLVVAAIACRAPVHGPACAQATGDAADPSSAIARADAADRACDGAGDALRVRAFAALGLPADAARAYARIHTEAEAIARFERERRFGAPLRDARAAIADARAVVDAALAHAGLLAPVDHTDAARGALVLAARQDPADARRTLEAVAPGERDPDVDLHLAALATDPRDAVVHAARALFALEWATRERARADVLLHRAGTRMIALSPDLALFARANGADVEIARVDTGEIVLSRELAGEASGLALDPRGALLAIGDDAGNLTVVDTLTGTTLARVQLGEGRAVGDLVFGPEPGAVTAISGDPRRPGGTLATFDLATARRTRSFDVEVASAPLFAGDLVILSDHASHAVYALDGTPRWRIDARGPLALRADGLHEYVQPAAGQAGETDVAIARDTGVRGDARVVPGISGQLAAAAGDVVAAVRPDGGITVVDVATHATHVFAAGGVMEGFADFEPMLAGDGRAVVTRRDDGSIAIADARTGVLAGTIASLRQGLLAVDGGRAIATGGVDDNLVASEPSRVITRAGPRAIWPIDGGPPVRCDEPLEVGRGVALGSAFAAPAHGELLVVDAATCAVRARMPLAPPEAIAGGWRDGRVVVFDGASRVRIADPAHGTSIDLPTEDFVSRVDVVPGRFLIAGAHRVVVDDTGRRLGEAAGDGPYVADPLGEGVWMLAGDKLQLHADLLDPAVRAELDAPAEGHVWSIAVAAAARRFVVRTDAQLVLAGGDKPLVVPGEFGAYSFALAADGTLVASGPGGLAIADRTLGETRARLVTRGQGWLRVAGDRVDGTPIAPGERAALWWQIGDRVAPGFTAWSRQRMAPR